MVVQQAKLQGAGLLFASDLISIRRQMAAKHGAEVVIDPTTDNAAELIREQTMPG